MDNKKDRKKINDKEKIRRAIEEADIKQQEELLEQEEIKIKKLQKKMLIFGIILVVLIIAYLIMALINKRFV